MKNICFGALLCLALVMTGCSNKPYVVTDYDTGYDFAALKTFAVVETRQNSQENLLISPFTFSHIHNVIDQEFAQRYQHSTNENTANFIVSYHIVIEEKLDPGSYDRLYGFGGYGYGFSRGYRAYPSPLFYGTTGGPRIYNQGSLIVDLIDGRSQKPIWRGVSEKRLRAGLTPAQQREILTNAVREVVAKFPPI